MTEQERPTEVQAGIVMFLGLEDIRKAIGNKWLFLSSTIESIVEREVMGAIGPQDRFFAPDETGLAIFFGALDAEQALNKTVQISEAIQRALQKEVASYGEISLHREVLKVAANGSLADIEQRLGALLENKRQQLREQNAERTAASARRALQDVRLQFSPVWERASRMLVMNRCLPDMATGFSSLSAFKAIANEGNMEEVLADLDIVVMSKIVDVLLKPKLSELCTIIVPVTERTLLSERSFGIFGNLLRSIPGEMLSQVVIEVTKMDKTLPLADTVGAIDRVAAIHPTVIVKLNGNPAVLSSLRPDKVRGVAWALNDWIVKDPGRKTLLTDMIALAKARRLSTFGHGANSVALAQIASEAGFDFIDGTAIHLNVADPRAPGRLKPYAIDFARNRASRAAAVGE